MVQTIMQNTTELLVVQQRAKHPPSGGCKKKCHSEAESKHLYGKVKAVYETF